MATNQSKLGRTAHKIPNHKEVSIATCHHFWVGKNSVKKFVKVSSQRADGQPRRLWRLTSGIRFFIRERTPGNGFRVGRTGDMFGRSRATIECVKFKSIDNSLTKSEPGASSKWTGNWNVRRGSTHKWLGCMLCTANTGNPTLDWAHHFHAASKAFFFKQTIFGKQECCNARPFLVF